MYFYFHTLNIGLQFSRWPVENTFQFKIIHETPRYVHKPFIKRIFIRLINFYLPALMAERILR